ncbi:uncharacterized protein DDB_G0286379-like [Sitophilus oryzae]|uniref:Uncharacterized protein DDB_G0286379-like n=1 Tax=Sitophilus oryzae TaxID=7048 RepID=A0A6J2XJB3_SITOR|nr:uncharacterized protein DDB_G0286379-like [Sitophilus oryzae]
MAQTDLIDTMSLNTLLTGLEPRLGQLIRATSKPNTFQQSQQRTFNGQNQNQSSRPTFQRNFNQPQQRAHHVNFDNNFNNNYSYEEYPNYDLNDNGNFQENDYYDEYSYDTPNPDNYSDFLDLTTKDQPPDTLIQDPTSEIQTQIQALNLEDMNPNLNFPEQKLL